jgi:prophage regulatory protein
MPIPGADCLAQEGNMNRSTTVTVMAIEPDKDVNKSLTEQLVETQRALLKLVAKEVVGEYIREMQCKSGEPKEQAIEFPIPEIGFVRLPQILEVIPIGKTSWWQGVREGRFPQPVKLSARCTAWRVEDIRELIKNFSD